MNDSKAAFAAEEIRCMNQPGSSVSVVIPCYNLGEYLPEAVESVRQQTCPPAELIIVDDGSTAAHTLAVLADYAAQGVTVYHTPNQGAPAARNYGISRTQSAYILCLDADDVLLPDFLTETVAVLDTQPAVGIAATWVEFFGNQEGSWQPHAYSPRKLLWENQIPSCSLFRKLCWQQAGGYKHLRACQDWELWITMVEEYGWQWAVVPKLLYRYRWRSGSITEFQELHRPELLHDLVNLHVATYQSRVADLFVALDTKLQQMRVELQKYQRDNKAQAAKLLSLKQSTQQPGQTPQAVRCDLVREIQATVVAHTPPDACIAVISKGDEQLLQLNGRQGWHFPCNADGHYAGYYPADSAGAIAQVEAVKAKGAAYLVLPSTALWWLDHYAEFKQHLLQHYQVVVDQKDTCLIFALHDQASATPPDGRR